MNGAIVPHYTWRVLLVDDDEGDYIIVREMLSIARQGKFLLEWASSFEEAHSKLQSGEYYDAVIVDYNLGVRTGTDLVQEAVSSEYPAPILMLTGQGSFDVDLEAMQAGAADYLSKKEINPALLERALRYAIERKQSEVALKQANASLAVANNSLAQVNANLRESEGRFRVALAGAPLTVFSQDQELRYTWIFLPEPSQKLSLASILGKRDDELLPPVDAERVIALKRQVMERGEKIRQEILVHTSEGQRHYLLVMEPQWDEAGRSNGLIGSALDITQLRQLEAWRLEHTTQTEVQRRLLEQREMERQQIARNLHDGPVQELVTLLFALQAAVDMTGEAETRQTLNEIMDSVRALVSELRGVCNELRPPLLMQFGLARAIRSYAEEFSGRYSPIQVVVDLDEDERRISDGVRLALYRIYQESLNNIHKHAQASQVVVRLRMAEHEVRMEIEDNGCGFDMPSDWLALVHAGHLGLVGMKERAEAAGGRFEVDARPGRGTVIRVMVGPAAPL